MDPVVEMQKIKNYVSRKKRVTGNNVLASLQVKFTKDVF